MALHGLRALRCADRHGTRSIMPGNFRNGWTGEQRLREVIVEIRYNIEQPSFTIFLNDEPASDTERRKEIQHA